MRIEQTPRAAAGRSQVNGGVIRCGQSLPGPDLLSGSRRGQDDGRAANIIVKAHDNPTVEDGDFIEGLSRTRR